MDNYQKIIDKFYTKRDFKLKAYSKKDNAILDDFLIMQTAFNENNKLSLLYQVLNNYENFIPIFYTEMSDKDNNDLYEYDIISIKNYKKDFYIKKIKEGYFLFLIDDIIDEDEDSEDSIIELHLITKQHITRKGSLFENLENLIISKN